MKKNNLMVFDLAGTTVEDDNAVPRCLHQAAMEYGLEVFPEEFQKTIGTNNIHLYQFMPSGRNAGFAGDFGHGA